MQGLSAAMRETVRLFRQLPKERQDEVLTALALDSIGMSAKLLPGADTPAPAERPTLRAPNRGKHEQLKQ